LNINASG